MRVNFPPPPPGPMGTYLGRVFQQLQQVLSTAVSANETAHRIILQSPNGTNYAVTVANDGTLETNVISRSTDTP